MPGWQTTKTPRSIYSSSKRRSQYQVSCSGRGANKRRCRTRTRSSEATSSKDLLLGTLCFAAAKMHARLFQGRVARCQEVVQREGRDVSRVGASLRVHDGTSQQHDHGNPSADEGKRVAAEELSYKQRASDRVSRTKSKPSFHLYLLCHLNLTWALTTATTFASLPPSFLPPRCSGPRTPWWRRARRCTSGGSTISVSGSTARSLTPSTNSSSRRRRGAGRRPPPLTPPPVCPRPHPTASRQDPWITLTITDT